MQYDLNTVDEVIDALGGNPAVGELTGSNATAVSNWRSSDSFPAWTYLILRRALKNHGKSAPDDLWAMRKPQKRQSSESAA